MHMQGFPVLTSVYTIKLTKNFSGLFSVLGLEAAAPSNARSADAKAQLAQALRNYNHTISILAIIMLHLCCTCRPEQSSRCHHQQCEVNRNRATAICVILRTSTTAFTLDETVSILSLSSHNCGVRAGQVVTTSSSRPADVEPQLAASSSGRQEANHVKGPAQIGIIMGSDSDLKTMAAAEEVRPLSQPLHFAFLNSCWCNMQQSLLRLSHVYSWKGQLIPHGLVGLHDLHRCNQLFPSITIGSCHVPFTDNA